MGDTAAGSGQEYKNWKDLEELDTTDQKVYIYTMIAQSTAMHTLSGLTRSFAVK